MKPTIKTLILSSILALIAAPLVQAHGDHSAGGNTPEARANRLEEALGLTEEQAKKIEALYTEQDAAVKALKEKQKDGDPKAVREEVKKLNAVYTAKVREVLTAEQLAKFEAQIKERQKAREAAGAGEKSGS